MDFPAVRHDDRRDRHAARQWRGGAATDYPVPVDVSDPSRLLLAHLSGARRRCDLVELPALFARLAGDGVGGISARALAAGNAAARRRRLTPCLRSLLSTNPPSLSTGGTGAAGDRKSTRLNSSPLMRISYAVFCLKKKKTHIT